jgi:ADP-heptose:LPS heptosyltransferase
VQILIIQTAFLGDVVLATPLIEKLHRFYPQANIDFLLRKGNEGLLAGHPLLRKVFIWDKKGGKWKNAGKLIKQFRQVRYDYIINLQRFFSSGVITILSGGRQTIGFNKNPLSFLFTRSIVHHIAADGELVEHEVQRNLRCIEALTDDHYELPKLYPSPIDWEATKELKKQLFITIAPASVWFTKQYPPEKWVELINHLPHQLTIYLLGAPGDAALCRKIQAAATHPAVQVLTGQLSLLQSAALMKDAVMNYVNDSAPLHLASAMDAPVTAVFCSTVPRFGYGPSGTLGRVVQIDYKLSCRPCGLHGHKKCPEGHFKCAYDIKVEQLTDNGQLTMDN